MGVGSLLFPASRHIDSLTYNRIVGQGFSNLTPFQQDGWPPRIFFSE